MANAKRFDVVAVVDTYKDESGQDKNKYLTIGTAWLNEKGIMNVKLDLPVGITEYALFPAKDKK